MEHKIFIPPKIWRFIAADDPLVDIILSRDLDSALTKREHEVVDTWLARNKSFHAIREHPKRNFRMLGDLITHCTGRAYQIFLTSHSWAFTTSSLLVHDSFFCMNDF
ncbi:unnamed protein product [Rotaria sp. Silwood1]|nr:unnamed protein product [Rotaria sp. Silwood1]CAF3357431.1 unnamed protein product [Rotaria sp. Silwood1]CAF4678078.1 unnamed protein product [Rotaria sp. Silwood1]